MSVSNSEFKQALDDALGTGILSLAGRGLKALPAGLRLEQLCDLTELGEIFLVVFSHWIQKDLSSNKLRAVPDIVCKLPDLERLICYHNFIEQVPNLRDLTSLTFVNLRSLPSMISDTNRT
jgi:hypothetical protein